MFGRDEENHVIATGDGAEESRNGGPVEAADDTSEFTVPDVAPAADDADAADFVPEGIATADAAAPERWPAPRKRAKTNEWHVDDDS